MTEQPTRRYKVVEKEEETLDTTTLTLASSGPVPGFKAGQYITVYFPELHVPEGKAYSLSSSPYQHRYSITVKRMGQFSNRLCSLAVGDSFTGSDPYGYFFSEEKSTPLVMLSVGIGVTPFRSLIGECLFEDPKRDILLCGGNRTVRDIVFGDELDMLQSAYPSLKVRHFISREKGLPAPFEEGRMNAARVLAFAREPDKSEYMLCGSISFVRDLWRGLRGQGIAEEKIYTEAFFTN